VHEASLECWHDFIFRNLLGSQEIVQSVFDIFSRHPMVGIIGPQHFDLARAWIGWGYNFELASILATRMGIALTPDRPLDFPSGSMFWARSAALRPLLDLGLSYNDFSDKLGQVDGTLARAIERLYYFACEQAGFNWVKISCPELFTDTSWPDGFFVPA
jgi:lipopolysaccharide biosynthesis protein